MTIFKLFYVKDHYSPEYVFNNIIIVDELGLRAHLDMMIKEGRLDDETYEEYNLTDETDVFNLPIKTIVEIFEFDRCLIEPIEF